jgi:hypothetical protein
MGKDGLTSDYTGSFNDFGTTYYTVMMASNFTTDSFGSAFPTLSTEVPAATNSTRLVFYPTSSVTLDEKLTGDNCESAVYIDNVKVSIIYEAEEE